MQSDQPNSPGTRCEIQELYFWLGEEAERVGFTPWQTAWLAYPAAEERDKPSTQTTTCEHHWQVAGINLRRDSSGLLECSKCGARQSDVELTDDQIWRFISDHVIG